MSVGREQRPRCPRCNEILARLEDDDANARVRRGHVCVRLRGFVEAGVQRDSEELEPVTYPPAREARTLSDAGGEDEGVQPSRCDRHPRDRRGHPMGEGIYGQFGCWIAQPDTRLELRHVS